MVEEAEADQGTGQVEQTLGRARPPFCADIEAAAEQPRLSAHASRGQASRMLARQCASREARSPSLAYDRVGGDPRPSSVSRRVRATKTRLQTGQSAGVLATMRHALFAIGSEAARTRWVCLRRRCWP